jgi:alkylation response protein AidB-like acyl-CoA dehydrogenase/ketosteroid isomerase-like protein
MYVADMTEEEFEVAFAKAQELSAKFRAWGPQCDRDNSFCYDSIQAFKDSGLTGLNVPKAYGGMGANILQTSKVISELSRGDSAITLAYNMHFLMVGMTGINFSEEQQKYWFTRIADGEIMFGAFSEARAGFSGLADVTAVPQPEGGWKLYGQKTWGTLSEAADILSTAATITDAEGNLPTDFEARVSAESLFIVEFDLDENGMGEGIRIEKTWDALGMHATGTQTIVYDGFYIPESGYVTEWRAGAFASLEWASLTFASIYLGMQYRILEEARALLAKKTLGATFGAIVAADTKVAGIGHIVDGIGDLAIRNEISRRTLWETCQTLIDGRDDVWPFELRVPYIGIAKICVADNVMQMAKDAMSMVGGSAFRRGAIFERLYRDAAASMYQPLNTAQSRTYIGEYLLQSEQSAEESSSITPSTTRSTAMTLKIPADFVPTFSERFAAGDLDGLLALYGDDVVAVPQPGARLAGKEQLGAGLSAFLGMAPYAMNMTQYGLVENENSALIFGDWTFDGQSPDGPVHIEARATIVLAKRGEGWEAVLDDFFSQG